MRYKDENNLIWESFKERGIPEKSGLSVQEKRLISNAITSNSILNGNERVPSPSDGLNTLSNVLDELGYSIDGDFSLPDISGYEPKDGKVPSYKVRYKILKKDPNNKDPFMPDLPIDGYASIDFIYSRMYTSKDRFNYKSPTRMKFAYEIICNLIA